MIKYTKINMRLIHNTIEVKVRGGCYLPNKVILRKDTEGGIGRVGMKMLMMRGGMGMINMINNIMGRGKGNMGSLLDKDRVRGTVGSVELVCRLTLYDLMIC